MLNLGKGAPAGSFHHVAIKGVFQAVSIWWYLQNSTPLRCQATEGSHVLPWEPTNYFQPLPIGWYLVTWSRLTRRQLGVV